MYCECKQSAAQSYYFLLTFISSVIAAVFSPQSIGMFKFTIWASENILQTLRPSVNPLFGGRLSWPPYLEQPPAQSVLIWLQLLLPLLTTGLNYSQCDAAHGAALTVCGTCGKHRAPVNAATAPQSRSEYDMAARVPPSRPWKDPKAKRWQVSRRGAHVTTGCCHCLSVTRF